DVIPLWVRPSAKARARDRPAFRPVPSRNRARMTIPSAPSRRETARLPQTLSLSPLAAVKKKPVIRALNPHLCDAHTVEARWMAGALDVVRTRETPTVGRSGGSGESIWVLATAIGRVAGRS